MADQCVDLESRRTLIALVNENSSLNLVCADWSAENTHPPGTRSYLVLDIFAVNAPKLKRW